MELTPSQLQEEILRLHTEVRSLRATVSIQRTQLERYEHPAYISFAKILKLGKELYEADMIDFDAFDDLERWAQCHK